MRWTDKWLWMILWACPNDHPGNEIFGRSSACGGFPQCPSPPSTLSSIQVDSETSGADGPKEPPPNEERLQLEPFLQDWPEGVPRKRWRYEWVWVCRWCPPISSLSRHSGWPHGCHRRWWDQQKPFALDRSNPRRWLSQQQKTKKGKRNLLPIVWVKSHKDDEWVGFNFMQTLEGSMISLIGWNSQSRSFQINEHFGIIQPESLTFTEWLFSIFWFTSSELTFAGIGACEKKKMLGVQKSSCITPWMIGHLIIVHQKADRKQCFQM